MSVSSWAVVLILAGFQTSPPSDRPNTVEGVTVIAPRPRPSDPKVLESFVDELAAPTVAGRVVGQIPRWTAPVCPAVMGASRKVGIYFVQRITAAARAAGAPIGRRGCAPNLIVAVTEEGDRLARELAARHRYRLFGLGRHQELEQFRASGKPVRWWHLSRLSQTDGAGAMQSGLGGTGATVGGGSVGPAQSAPSYRLDPTRLRTSTRSSINGVLIVVDAAEARKVSAQALSAYVAMVGLAQLPQEPEIGASDSILNLFDTAPKQRAKPLDLTAFDRAYLKGLYSMRTDVRYARQRQQIESRMLQELGAAQPSP